MRRTLSSRPLACAATLFLAASVFSGPALRTARAQTTTEFRAARVTINLNNTSYQDLYENDTGVAFTPTRLVIRSTGGALAAEGSTTSILISSSGGVVSSATIPASAFDELAAVYVHNFTGRGGFLIHGERLIARPDTAYGGSCTLQVDVYGVLL